MEPLTHFLTGACISRASGLNRKTVLATTTCVLAAEAADLDVVWYFKNSIEGFAHHRGITHTFVGAPFVAAFVIGFVYLLWLWKRRRKPAPAGATGLALPETPRWGLLYVYALIAALSHILLDFTNNYGVRPFEPFQYQWYSWDIIFIFEPLLYVFFFAGLALPALFGLINEEIGTRRRGPRGQVGAIAALVLMLALWGARDYQHRRAVAALDARLYHGAEPLRASAFPYYLNPFKWYGVAETGKFYELVMVDSLTPDVDPRSQSETRYKPPETPVTQAAKKTYLGRVYLDWAKYPMLEVEPVEAPLTGLLAPLNDRRQVPGGPPNRFFLVRFYDLRFEYPDLMRRRGRRTLGARVLLDQNLNQVAAWFGTRSQRPDVFGEQKEGK